MEFSELYEFYLVRKLSNSETDNSRLLRVVALVGTLFMLKRPIRVVMFKYSLIYFKVIKKIRNFTYISFSKSRVQQCSCEAVQFSAEKGNCIARSTLEEEAVRSAHGVILGASDPTTKYIFANVFVII